MRTWQSILANIQNRQKSTGNSRQSPSSKERDQLWIQHGHQVFEQHWQSFVVDRVKLRNFPRVVICRAKVKSKYVRFECFIFVRGKSLTGAAESDGFDNWDNFWPIDASQWFQRWKFHWSGESFAFEIGPKVRSRRPIVWSHLLNRYACIYLYLRGLFLRGFVSFLIFFFRFSTHSHIYAGYYESGISQFREENF